MKAVLTVMALSVLTFAGQARAGDSIDDTLKEKQHAQRNSDRDSGVQQSLLQRNPTVRGGVSHSGSLYAGGSEVRDKGIFVSTRSLRSEAGSQITCKWIEPGHDKYTGSLTAPIDNYRIDEGTRRKLKFMVENNLYSRIIKVDRNSHVLLKNMSFGSKGRTCDHVDFSGLKGEVEIMIFEADGETIGRPSVCNNIVQVIDLEQRDEAPVAAVVPGVAFESLPPTAAGLSGYSAVAGVPSGESYVGSFGGYGVAAASFGGAGGGGFYGAPCDCYCDPIGIPAAVPEPAMWLLMLIGIGAIIFAKRDKGSKDGY